MAKTATAKKDNPNSSALPKADVISDYKIAFMSRQASLIGRKEVLTGKAKFGIFGDGKEVAQVALARSFEKGDWRSGYYRDQTLMMALGVTTIRTFFAQLYADTDPAHDPATAGRQMNSHFVTRYISEDGEWLSQLDQYNSSADMSPTGGQMARLVGLGYASKIYRDVKDLAALKKFSNRGNEVAFGMIGNASTSEGVFFEAVNAIGVLQIPVALSVWDDEYGISVPQKYHTVKESISKALGGMQYEKGKGGIDFYVVKGWDYVALCDAYKKGVEKIRKEHVPAIFHIVEMTQPQGHSTSGSHERYKPKERLEYEVNMDCLKKMREWMIAEGISTKAELDKLEAESLKYVESERQAAWDDYIKPLEDEKHQALALIRSLAGVGDVDAAAIEKIATDLEKYPTTNRKLIHSNVRRALWKSNGSQSGERQELQNFDREYRTVNAKRYNTFLLAENGRTLNNVEEVPAEYGSAVESIDGRMVINRYFEHLFAKDPRVFLIGEDCGKIGGVNAEYEGLQAKVGESRLTDTGIREATILGQAIGAAMRGLRPFAEIQYLDYLLYAFQTMSDDLATLHYRSAGGQLAPVIVRTRGHRLEGIWHTGSPMGMIIHGLRGMHVCVPRNSTQAVGMYNTLLKCDDPAVVVEVLNGFRVKESVPANLTEFSLPLGVPEVLREGRDITLVTYGACVRIAQEAVHLLEGVGIDVELIDVQTLLPFDTRGIILQSIEKTNTVLFLDEDVPGGATAFMLEQVLDAQGGYEHLDAQPKTLCAKPHRGPYGTDGDYYSKPSAEDIVETIATMMHERNPSQFPNILQ